MTDTDTNQPVNETPAEENLQGKGGTLSFDAASSIAEAFDKLKIGAAPEGEPAAETPAEGENPKPEAEEKPAVKAPTADALSKLRGNKKATEKPTENSVETPQEEMPKEADSLKKWAVNMKKDWKAEKSRREELEAKVAELEKSRNSSDPEEVTRLRQINEEYERELQVSRVEATKEFKDAVVVPMQQIRESVDTLATKYEISQRDLFEAFSETDPSARADKLSDIAAGMNDRDKFSLYELEGRFNKVQSTREKVVNNAKLALEKINEHRQEQAKTQQEEYSKRYNSAMDKVWEEAENAVPLLKKVDGDEEWNKQLDDAQQFARGLNFDSVDEDVRARVAVRSAIAPVIYGQFVQLFNKYQELEKAMEKYQSATPRAGGGSTPASSAPKEEFDDFLEVMKAKLSS
jgi:hypothetical protein